MLYVNLDSAEQKDLVLGFGEEEMPILGSLTKYTSNPPQWFLNVDKTRIELKSEQLYNPGMFALVMFRSSKQNCTNTKTKRLETTFLKPMMSNLTRSRTFRIFRSNK